MREKYIGMITQFYENNPAMQRDEAFRSAGMAAYALMMVAAAHGYDTCTAEFRLWTRKAGYASVRSTAGSSCRNVRMYTCFRAGEEKSLLWWIWSQVF